VESKSFEDVRKELEDKVKPELSKKQIEELEKQAGVKLDDTFFGPRSPAPPRHSCISPGGKAHSIDIFILEIHVGAQRYVLDLRAQLRVVIV